MITLNFSKENIRFIIDLPCVWASIHESLRSHHEQQKQNTDAGECVQSISDRSIFSTSQKHALFPTVNTNYLSSHSDGTFDELCTLFLFGILQYE